MENQTSVHVRQNDKIKDCHFLKKDHCIFIFFLGSRNTLHPLTKQTEISVCVFKWFVDFCGLKKKSKKLTMTLCVKSHLSVDRPDGYTSSSYKSEGTIEKSIFHF